MENNLQFRRQFIILPFQSTLFKNWEFKIINNLNFYVHPELGFHVINSDNCTVVVLGYIIDYRHPTLFNSDLIEKYLTVSKDFNSFLENTFHSGGRWAVYYKDNDNQVIFNDATGMRQIFHSINSHGIISSSETLIAKILEFSEDENVIKEFINKIKDIDTMWFPNTSTSYSTIKSVLNNHLLDISKNYVNRYWPNKSYKINYTEAIERMHNILKHSVISITTLFPDYAVAMTAGNDSRLTLGYFKKYANNQFKTYTIKNQFLNDNSPDIFVPRALAEFYDYPHTVVENIKCNDKSFEAIYKENSLYLKPTFYEMAYNLYSGFSDKTISINSTMSEIARQKYPYFPFKPNHHDLKNLTYFGNLNYAEKEFKKWDKEIQNNFKKFRISLEDLFYMEQRGGRWNASNKNNWDIVQESFELWNVRELFLLTMSINKRYKKEKTIKFIKTSFNSLGQITTILKYIKANKLIILNLE